MNYQTRHPQYLGAEAASIIGDIVTSGFEFGGELSRSIADARIAGYEADTLKELSAASERQARLMASMTGEKEGFPVAALVIGGMAVVGVLGAAFLLTRKR